MTDLERVIEQSPKLRPRTKELYLACVREFIAFVGRDPQGWTPDSVQGFYAYQLSKTAPQSANVKMSAIRYASKRRAAMLRDSSADFAQFIETAKPSQTARPKAFSTDELKALLRTCSGTQLPDVRDRAIITLLRDTGMRRFSLIRLEWEDIKTAHGLHFAETRIKGGRTHSVLLSEEAFNTLVNWRLCFQDKPTGRIFRRIRVSIEIDAYVMDGSLTESGLYDILSRRGAQAGVSDCNPHRFRHTFVTHAKAKGFSNAQIAAITGHLEGGKEASRILDGTYTDKSFGTAQLISQLGDLYK